MFRACVNFDFGFVGRCRKSVSQNIFSFGRALIIVFRHGDEVICTHGRNEKMRAIGFIRGEAAAMETCASPNSVRHGRRRNHRHRAAHAITRRADLARCINRRLRVEPFDKGFCVCAVRVL